MKKKLVKRGPARKKLTTKSKSFKKNKKMEKTRKKFKKTCKHCVKDHVKCDGKSKCSRCIKKKRNCVYRCKSVSNKIITKEYWDTD